MANKENLSTPFIYLRSTGEKIPVTKEQHDAFYKEASRIRDKEQNHGRCVCPYRYIWKCDGDCIDCEYHRAGDTLSLDVPTEDGSNDLYNTVSDTAPTMEDVIADRILLEQLFAKLRELDPDADLIIELLGNGLSDRKIAEALGRKQRTFADQMKKYRTELRKIRGY
ncbi:sigma-70 family RNA polymerase sigma factor [Clostridioides difficile]|nr:sigma-70 family RNA polymerase sigma factor [Clostridioides difficile]MCJ0380980.1 sigma-70 family RNA polymerase sigma factor [Clostridioides difficile]MDB0376616.1 hypothetical protein [Clostridioides difficile]MDB0394948.1 hypothetical protein [Clostridioides difficile]HBE8721259.1 sigma-70 family RNA polymerase sigma factor [Clostridioides difficile]